MTLAHVIAVAGLAYLVVGPSPDRMPARERGIPASSAIGVIDVAKAFEQNPRVISMKQELEVLKKGCDDRLREFSRTIKELEAAIDVLDPDSEPRRRKQLIRDLQIREAEGTERLMKDSLDREVMMRELAIYDEIEVAARKVAEAKGVALVFRLSRTEATGDATKLSTAALRQRHSAARSRDVLYAANEIDLTDDVITQLLVPPDKAGAKK